MVAMGKYSAVLRAVYTEVLILLPDLFSRWRVKYLRNIGCKIGTNVVISPNVRIKGRFEIGNGSSIAQNCTIAGEGAGIFVGANVMVAPNCVLVAFDHGFSETSIPMVKQKYVEAPIFIEDDVWIAANCTITAGVRIGKGSIVGANSVVTSNVPPFSIVGGVPAKIIKNRLEMG
jgi:acetyltransferase-like isoleucine patch superfamily enzyme